MEGKITNNKANSYTYIQDYFLTYWVNVIVLGPAMLYLQLLSYCHKRKDVTWPSVWTLNKRIGITTKTLIKYRHTLVEYGFIKEIVKQKSSTDEYFHNFNQLVILDNKKIFFLHRNDNRKIPKKWFQALQKNHLSSSRIILKSWIRIISIF